MSRRGVTQRVRVELDTDLDKRRPILPAFNALLGDGQGNVLANATRPNYVYVREFGRGIVQQVWNTRVPLIHNLPVVVGYDDITSTLLEVLTIRRPETEIALAGGSGSEAGGETYILPGIIGPHHRTHEFGRGNLMGSDVTWIKMEQIEDGLVCPSSTAMCVDQLECLYGYGTGHYHKDTETDYDLSGSVPAAGLGRWVLVYIDTTVDPHNLTHVEGASYPINLFPSGDWTTIPDTPVGGVPLAVVFLTGGMTELSWLNVYDARLFPTGVSGVMTPTQHELAYDDVHSDVDGDIDPDAGRLLTGNAAGTLWTYLDLGARGALLKVDAAATALEYLAAGGAGAILMMDNAGNDPQWLVLGARGGILKVNAAADALEYLVAGGAGAVFTMDDAGNDPEWTAIGGARTVLRVNDAGTDSEFGDPIDLASAEIQAILDFAAGDLDLDTQVENTVFAGPAAGAAAKPAFRALVNADIPSDISPSKVGGHTHVVNEDLSGMCDGAKVVFPLNNEAQPETTALFKNGTRMRLNDDYTETDLYNSVTFGAAPGAADDVWIDYIPVT